MKNLRETIEDHIGYIDKTIDHIERQFNRPSHETPYPTRLVESVPAYTIRDTSGNLVVTPLLLAKSQALLALGQLGPKSDDEDRPEKALIGRTEPLR